MSFQSLESGLSWWRDDPPPGGTGAAVAYRVAGRSWIAVGTPLVDDARRAEAARRFAQAAGRDRRRAVFFGVERVDPFAGFHRIQLGLQSELVPERWPAILRRNPKLREQVRRARAKGVTVRRVDPSEIAPGRPLRAEVDRLAAEWLAARPMEPMQFLVSVELYHAAAEHLYFAAEHRGRLVTFFSLIPIFERRGWMMEDMLRSLAAPNGTTELVIDRIMRELDGDRVWVTPGLTPLAGQIPLGLRLTRAATVALYDFEGLRRFRSRLSPARWSPVWLAWNRGPAVSVIADVLRAFAGGRLLPFAWRSITRHPNGPPWAVALPLVFWTVFLAWLTATGRSQVLGFSTAALAAWTIFDAALATLLFRVAHRPRPASLATMAAAAGIDATLSIRHLAVVGFGATGWTLALRGLATLGPLLGTTGLAWSWHRARRASGARLAARASRTDRS